jgi:hypothetical protein
MLLFVRKLFPASKYSTIILPAGLTEFKNLVSHIQGKKNNFRVCVNIVLRKVSGPKRKEGTQKNGK